MQATTTPGFRGYVQPLHVQHPSSSPLGSNEKLSCGSNIGTVRLSDRPKGGLHSIAGPEAMPMDSNHKPFLGCENNTKTVFLTLSCLLRGYK